MVNRNLFIAPKLTPKLPSRTSFFDRGYNSSPKLDLKLGNNMTPEQIYNAGRTVSNVISDPKVQAGIKVGQSVINKARQSSGNRPGNPSPPGRGDSSAASGLGYLSSAPNPTPTRLGTGIPLTLLEKNYTKVEENVCSPMHTTHVLFSLPVSSTSQIYDWFMKVNSRDYQTRLQEEVNWALPINAGFSAANITNAMNELYKVLQIYFFYRSIDSYCNIGPNQNDAMYAIRSEWDFNTNFKMSEIARLLARTPIPPNMLELSRYLMSNYNSGMTPNSTIIKIVPFPRYSQSLLTSNTNLDNCLTSLTNTTNIDVWNTLGRVCKSWVPGETANIYDPPINPSYDLDFITIFNNLPSANGITGKTYSPSVTAITDNFTYLSWNNQLDGIAVALTDAYITTTSTWCNGMVSPQVSSSQNRFSYYKVAGNISWTGSRFYPFTLAGRLDTYMSDGTTESVSHRFGADMVVNVSGLMASTTCINAVDWLLSSTSIKGTNVQGNFMPNTRGRKRSK